MTSATAPYIEVEGLSKTFEGSRQSVPVHALDDVNITVQRGEFLAIVGPSGCGKSTLMRVVAGLRKATSGSTRIDGEPVTGPVKVGFVFQTPALLPWRSSLDNVLLAPQLAGLRVADYRERARELLDRVGLAGFESQLPGELSGGMQQRVALARALIIDPELLMMDEPFGALDAMTRDEMNLLLLRVWDSGAERKTVLFVTHSIPEAVFLADRIMVMTPRPGRVAEVVDSVLDRPREHSMQGTAEFAKQVVDIYDRLHQLPTA